MKQPIMPTPHDIVHQDLLALLYEDEQAHLLQGAHFILQDNGLYFAKWLGVATPRRFSSSHASEKTGQYSVYGEKMKECLFSTIKYQDQLCTWLQLEPYSHALSNLVQHGVCFVQYKFTGKNIGPYGTSVHTDTNPIVIPNARICPEAVLKCDGV